MCYIFCCLVLGWTPIPFGRLSHFSKIGLIICQMCQIKMVLKFCSVFMSEKKDDFERNRAGHVEMEPESCWMLFSLSTACLLGCVYRLHPIYSLSLSLE